MCFSMFFPNASQIFVINSSPPSSLILVSEKLACIPLPFQSVAPSGFGCHSMCSRTSLRCAQLNSERPRFGRLRPLRPLRRFGTPIGPTATSALIPSTFNPASKHWSKWSSMQSLPYAILCTYRAVELP